MVLGLWSWDFGLGTLVLGLWSWDFGLGTLVFELGTLRFQVNVEGTKPGNKVQRPKTKDRSSLITLNCVVCLQKHRKNELPE
jgi:hypothetical protein